MSSAVRISRKVHKSCLRVCTTRDEGVTRYDLVAEWGIMVGYLIVDEDDFVQNAFIKEKYRGQGLGKWLYKKVIADRGKLRTNWDWATTEAAKRVWRSLLKDYHGRRFSGYLTVFNRKR